MTEFKFEYQGKNIELDVEKCGDIFSRARGLMFRKKSKPLLFVFKKLGRGSIHSFFCKPFAAIWFDGDKIIDVKLINSWKFSIKPKERFDKLLEIPSKDVAFKTFLDGNRKI